MKKLLLPVNIPSPEEKAKEIYFAMLNEGKGLTSSFLARECALICVNEVLENGQDIWQWAKDKGMPAEFWKFTDYNKYWQQVKQEIQKL